MLCQLYLAGEDVAKGREGVIQGFVVNGLVEVLDKNIAHTRLPEGGISLGPHDSDWLSFHHIKIHGVQSSFSCRRKSREVTGKVPGGYLHISHASVCYLLTPCNNNNAAIFNTCTIIIKEKNSLNALKQAVNMSKGVKVLQQTMRLMSFLQAAGKSVGGSCSGLAWSTCLPVLINHMLLSHMPLSNAAGLHLNTIRISAHVVEMSSIMFALTFIL